MESEFPSNNQFPPKAEASKTPEKEEVQKVISGQAIERKKPLGRRFLETFNVTDNKSVVGWVYTDVIIPQAKNLIYDIFKMGLEMKLFGESRGGASRGSFGQQAAYTAYNRMSAPMVSSGRPDPRGEPGHLSRQARQMHDFRDIIIPSRAEATVVLDKLYSLLSSYEVVSVSDYYAACGITPAFTDERWGWYSLAGSDISPTRDGWLVDLPAPEPIQ